MREKIVFYYEVTKCLRESAYRKYDDLPLLPPPPDSQNSSRGPRLPLGTTDGESWLCEELAHVAKGPQPSRFLQQQQIAP
mmetsp:Transcript_15980/g.65726  ORF Transcript_15980/g.65726 Transcript_15980/m.65726 type:complete len:80 (+) Transcript_15980:2562-2801(+)